jgi:hypothetical protein
MMPLELDQLAAESANEASRWWDVVETGGANPLSVAKALAFSRLAREAQESAHNVRYLNGQGCPLACFCQTKERKRAAKAAQKETEGNRRKGKR